MFRVAIVCLVLCLCLLSLLLANRQADETKAQTERQPPKDQSDKPNSPEIDKSISQLGNKNFEIREAASRTLEGFGLQALEPLRRTASTSIDAEVRKRAGDLIRAIEKAHEMEIEFAWFDGLGFPDLAKCQFVRVSDGAYYYNGTREISYHLGFLVRDEGARFTVLHPSLWTHNYTKSDSKKPEDEKVGYVTLDLGKETTEILKSLQQPEDKDDIPRRFRKAELFVWARTCAAQGKPKLAEQLFAQAKQIDDKQQNNGTKTFHQIIAHDIAHGQMWQAVEAFGDLAVSRKELLARFERIVRHFPENPHWQRAKETAELLKKMIAEDEAYARKTHKPAKEMTKEERIAELIFRLRDQNGQQFMQPGYCDIFIHDRHTSEGGDKSPAQQLVDIGYDSVPQLIAALDDARFTRSVGFQRNFYFSHFVLQVGDCAEAVLERIAARTFWEPRSSSAAMLKDGQVDIVKRNVQEWWKEFRQKGEKQMLIEGVRSGDFESPRQAERLVKKYPESAVPAIRQGVKNAKDDWICGDLVRIVTQLKDESSTAFLQEQLHGTYLLSRVAAARGLFDRGHEEVVTALIGEWKFSSLGRAQEDLINFLLWCGKPEAVKALAKDLQKRPIDDTQQVIEAISSPGWGWEKYQKSLPAAVQQAIDELLIGELDDFRKCKFTGTWASKNYSDPCLCDMSAQVLADRWKLPISFDLSTSEETRDRQRIQLKNEWLKKQRYQPVR
jgi:HEAT repeat protein